MGKPTKEELAQALWDFFGDESNKDSFIMSPVEGERDLVCIDGWYDLTAVAEQLLDKFWGEEPTNGGVRLDVLIVRHKGTGATHRAYRPRGSQDVVVNYEGKIVGYSDRNFRLWYEFFEPET